MLGGDKTIKGKWDNLSGGLSWPIFFALKENCLGVFLINAFPVVPFLSLSPYISFLHLFLPGILLWHKRTPADASQMSHSSFLICLGAFLFWCCSPKAAPHIYFLFPREFYQFNMHAFTIYYLFGDP